MYTEAMRVEIKTYNCEWIAFGCFGICFADLAHLCGGSPVLCCGHIGDVHGGVRGRHGDGVRGLGGKHRFERAPLGAELLRRVDTQACIRKGLAG